ncbi:MAG TPA: hypothetical protein PKK94_12350 [Leptospiraceae bacterium]|nr:hypothetical protein [Leptospiraceae bacterium]
MHESVLFPENTDDFLIPCRIGQSARAVPAEKDCLPEELKEDVPSFGAMYSDSYGRSQAEFRLPKDLTLTLVSGYSVTLRHRIVTRWMELEEQVKPPVLPGAAPGPRR